MLTNTAEQKNNAHVHPAFSRLRHQYIESLKIIVEEYEHKITKTKHYHLAADNAENVFLVGLRTIPTDSTGVAHILEHTALCGSKRYPVRDPFFMMLRRSLNTFMNAFTSSDWTGYPFATKNRKDFNNLLDVYLDAVFFANLSALDFAQEGHRLEFAKIDDPNSELVHRGVVLNEMKGAMSAPVSMLWHTLCTYLYPSSTYHYNSGGDPAHIVDLSYEQLKTFYQRHYHPSNAVFFTYGDIPAHEHHAKFDSLVLTHFQALPDNIGANDEKRHFAPLTIEEYYPFDDPEHSDKKTHHLIGWLLGKNIQHDDLIKAQLLSNILLDNSASPLRKALETTKLGTAPSPLCGVEDDNREMAFMCGVEGSQPEHAQAVEELIMTVLKDVAEKGVPADKLEAALNQLELSQREITGGSHPYGLQLILTALPAAIHRGDPITLLNLDPTLEKLRKDIQDPNYVKQLVQHYLLDNPHRVRLTLKPDIHLSKRRLEMEQAGLAKRKATLTEQQKQAIVTQARALAARQERKEEENILPKVGLEDIPADFFVAQGKTLNEKKIPLHFYDQPTNGLVYQDIIINLPRLDDEWLDVFPYYVACLTELGCNGKDYLATQAWQARVSGGIGASNMMHSDIDNVQKTNAYFILSGKALARHRQDLTELLERSFTTARFDEYQRIRELIAQIRAHRNESITQSGHSLAMLAASSGWSPIAALSHRLGGLQSIKQVNLLADSLENDTTLRAFAGKMQQIHETLLHAPRQFLAVAEDALEKTVRQDIDTRWPSPHQSHHQAFTLSPCHQQTQQAWTANTQINFCAKAYATVPYSHQDAPVFAVLAHFLRHGYLHRVIREQGGAYGGGAAHDADIGAFRFYSYRDPRLTETLKDFDQAIHWMLSEKHDNQQIEEAILGVISGIDKPSSPAGEAKKAFYNELSGLTKTVRQHYREGVLNVSLDSLKKVTEQYLQPKKASTAVVTNKETLAKAGHLGMEVYSV